MGQPAKVANLKTLKAPEEGGSKKDYKDFIEKITNHVAITWNHGKDVADILKETKLPVFKEPAELSLADAQSRIKVMRWDLQVNRHIA